MLHMPVDHRLRGFYRALCVLSGLTLVVWGVIAFGKTSGMDMFDQDGERVLGLSANPALAIASIAVGALVVLVTLIGRNADMVGNFLLGAALMIVGLAALAVLRTSANYLAFSIANVNVIFVIGTILLTGGMYSGVSKRR